MTMTMELKDKMWEGERVFVVGGGSSLTEFDWKMLEGEKVIGINRAWEQTRLDIHFSLDSTFYRDMDRDRIPEFLAHDSLKVFGDLRDSMPLAPPYVVPVFVIDDPHAWGDSLESGIGHGCNSGTCAVNLADVLGAETIYLLGFDLVGDWWHNGYKKPTQRSRYGEWIQHWKEIAPKIRARVVNLNPASALKEFPTRWPEEVLV